MKVASIVVVCLALVAGIAGTHRFLVWVPSAGNHGCPKCYVGDPCPECGGNVHHRLGDGSICVSCGRRAVNNPAPRTSPVRRPDP